jgi:ribA/ribD-fused uncharacterized protein
MQNPTPTSFWLIENKVVVSSCPDPQSKDYQKLFKKLSTIVCLMTEIEFDQIDDYRTTLPKHIVLINNPVDEKEIASDNTIIDLVDTIHNDPGIVMIHCKNGHNISVVLACLLLHMHYKMYGLDCIAKFYKLYDTRKEKDNVNHNNKKQISQIIKLSNIGIITPHIKFYGAHNLNGQLSNFYYPKELVIVNEKGVKESWKSTEHFFQAQKFIDFPTQYNNIKASLSSAEAAKMGRIRYKDAPLRADWESVKDDIMENALMCKFTQNKYLSDFLISTGDKVLIESTIRDTYWADGGNGFGINKLGNLLMKVRSFLNKALIEQKQIKLVKTDKIHDSNEPDKPVKVNKTAKIAKAVKTDKMHDSDEPEKVNKTAKADKMHDSDEPVKVNKTAQADKIGKTVKKTTKADKIVDSDDPAIPAKTNKAVKTSKNPVKT